MKRLICGTIKLKQLLVVFIFLSISGQLSAQTITISTGGETGTSGTNWSTSGTNPVTISASGDATINTSVVQVYLNSGVSVIINATTDIRLSNAISKTAGTASLTFQAGRDIFIQAGISSSGSSLPLTFNADSNDDNLGAIAVSDNLSTNGGAITFKDDITFNGVAAQAINSGAAAIAFNGEVMLSNTSGVTLTASDYDISFTKAVNSGNSFALDATARTWNDAYTAHSSTNSYLATITSRMELAAAMAVVPSGGAWLGGSDQETEGTWKWVTGPENGTVFWNTGKAPTGGATGYIGTNNSFVNWNGGEPNDSGSNEDALQITSTRTLGEWNDLPANGTTLASVVETELAPSPLTINAGTGTVTFSGSVGLGKPLKSLSITAATTAINGGSVTTNAGGVSVTQSYSGNITLGNASTVLTMLDTPSAFTLKNVKSITNLSGSHATLTIKTTAPIIMEAGSSISSSSGALNVVLWADTDANGGYIRTNSGCSITTNGGHLWMGGGSGSNTWNGLTVGNGYALGNELNSNGILIIGSSIATNGGNVALFGKSRLGAAVGNDGSAENTNVDGIRISPFASSLINSGAGSILIDGVSQGTNQVALGVEFCSLSNVTHLITSSASGDAIIITGTGSQSAGTQVNTNGVFVHNGTTISATGGGNIKITGVGGSVGSTQQATYFSEGSLVNPGSGNLTVTGNSIYLAGTFSGSGTLTIQPNTANTTIGIGGGAGTLQLPSSLFPTNFADGFSTITIGSASAGNITVSGTTTYNDPLTFKTAGNIFVSTGASLTGAPAGSDGIKSSLVFWADASANSIGGVWFQPSSSLTTNGGQIYIGGGADGNSDQLPDGYAYGTYDFIRPFNGTDYDIGSGILIEGNLNSGGGDITAWGFAPLSISHSAGVHIAHSGVVNAGGGNILLNGQSDKGAAYIRGVWIGDGVASASSAVVGTTGTGTLTITGQSAVSEDILLDVSALSTENGNISIDGNDYLFFNAGTKTTNTITSGTGKVQIASDAIIIIAGINTIRSNGELVISPKTSSRPISLGTNVANSLNLPSTFFTDNFLDGFSQITVGSASQTGNITSTSLTFRDNMRLQTASPAKVVVTANNTLTLNAGVKLTIDKELELQTGAKIVKLTQ